MKPPVEIPYREFVKEHKRLIKVLHSSNRKQMKEEARDQKNELDKLLKRR